ncbi:MAG TPA: class I SAM-dependent methyltransferase [Chthonomonadaceae bacterium]|nr:class I SAM-dependent methyltransferase [Chthonomonadaceae bacterium]
MRGAIQFLQSVEQRVARYIGLRLEERDVLIIGPGQGSTEMAFFGVKNRVVGIDLDVIARGFSLSAYLAMLRRNGPTRMIKTLARKCLGLDALAARELKKQLGIRRFPSTSLRQMDAARMAFPDASFDFVYTFAVFEHIPKPDAAIQEIVRVLRPGGACYISLHLYTSEGGCHDPRVFADDPQRPPYWAHLRPQHREKVQPNAYLNELRLAEWHRLFQEHMPGVQFETDGFHQELHERLSAELSRIRANGELQDYADEELLSVNLIAIWRKPAQEIEVTGQAVCRAVERDTPAAAPVAQSAGKS